MVINRYFLKNTLLFLRAQELNIGISTNMLQCVVVPLATFLHILRVVSPRLQAFIQSTACPINRLRLSDIPGLYSIY